jgi:subfamily B ATP-binding cassette protein MsbA
MGIAASERIYSLLQVQPLIRYDDTKPNLKIKEGRIEISNVDFSYNEERQVLHNISFSVEPNKTTAIVGASGSGKSTLISLLLRFYDVRGGSIKIDGQDIRDINLRSLRDNIAFVSQDVVLFDDTIKANILFGKLNASDEDIIEASKHSAAHAFIQKQPQQYDTPIGERGINLSGGQRQMISIARAMLKEAPILLLDEATSSLDAKSEKIVQNSLEYLMKGRTTIVIAHRLSTIINADKIIVFDNGKIIEEGTHESLIKKDGAYSKLYSIQFASKDTEE